jgi:hypothetical protein
MRLLSLALAAPALFAQQAPSLDQAYASQSKVIEGMLLTDPAGALEKAKALLPTPSFAFDKSTAQATMKSRTESIALVQIYFLVARTSRLNGDFEGAKEAYEKAADVAKAAKADTLAGLSPVIENWKSAEAKSKQALEEGKARFEELSAKPADQLDEQGKQELNNFKIHQANVERAPKVVSQLMAAANELDEFSKASLSNAEKMGTRLKTEQEDLVKFKGSKPKFVAQVLKETANITDKEQLISLLSRLTRLDPANKAVVKKLDQTLGKIPATPEPAAKGGKKKGK